MNSNQLASRRNAAVRVLQLKLSNCNDPYWVRVYEKALSLAFNPDREISEKFYSRLLNDAKRTIRRDRKGVPTIVSFYVKKGKDSEILNDNLAVDHPSPESDLQAKQLVNWIGEICKSRHKSSAEVFRCMLEGFTVAETARKLEITSSMVKKLRQEIKTIALDVFNV